MELQELLRIGTVTARNAEIMCCKVTFSDTFTNGVTSKDLPVLITRAHGDTYYDLPDIGSKVLCAFLPNGHEEGFILGSYYPKGKVSVMNDNIYLHRFNDGTYIEYDRKKHKLTASCIGDAVITAKGNLSLLADNINLVAKEKIELQANQIISHRK